MATRPILGLVSTLGSLRRQGEDIDAVLARHGIDLEHVDPTARIERALELRIYTEVAEVLRDPLAGLKAGNAMGIGSYGPLIMLLLTCTNALEALRAGIHYQRLTYLYGSLRLEPGERNSALVLTHVPLPPRAFRFRVDGEVAGTWKLGRDLQSTFAMDFRPECVEMPYPRPPEHAAYESLFQCPVTWDRSETRFHMSNEYLHTRFPTADATAHRFYRTQCDQLLVQLDDDAGDRLADRILAHLALFNGALPGQADVAAALGLNERTFRRQLSAEGQNYRSLLDQARFSKARSLLGETRLPIDAIAQQLGYSESAAFIHAFRRWSGQSPAAWRRGQPGTHRD